MLYQLIAIFVIFQPPINFVQTLGQLGSMPHCAHKEIVFGSSAVRTQMITVSAKSLLYPPNARRRKLRW